MTEGDIYLAISLVIIWTIGFVAFRRMRARQKAEQLRVEQQFRELRAKMEADRQAMRERNTAYNAKRTPAVTETKTQRARYDDRRVVADNSDDIMLQNMLIMNVISQPEPVYVNTDSVSRVSTYDYSSSSSDSSSSYSSYDSSSSSDSGSSSSFD